MNSNDELQILLIVRAITAKNDPIKSEVHLAIFQGGDWDFIRAGKTVKQLSGTQLVRGEVMDEDDDDEDLKPRE